MSISRPAVSILLSLIFTIAHATSDDAARDRNPSVTPANYQVIVTTYRRANQLCMASEMEEQACIAAKNIEDWLDGVDRREKKSCRQRAERFIQVVRPAFDQMLGRYVALELQDASAAFLQISGRGQIQQVSDDAEVRFERGDSAATINLHGVCGGDRSELWATLAHELGHVLAIDAHGSWEDSRLPWSKHPAEIAATAWGLRLYQQVGLRTQDFDASFSASHIQAARLVNGQQ
jgi:hypothetical protein